MLEVLRLKKESEGSKTNRDQAKKFRSALRPETAASTVNRPTAKTNNKQLSKDKTPEVKMREWLKKHPELSAASGNESIFEFQVSS